MPQNQRQVVCITTKENVKLYTEYIMYDKGILIFREYSYEGKVIGTKRLSMEEIGCIEPAVIPR